MQFGYRSEFDPALDDQTNKIISHLNQIPSNYDSQYTCNYGPKW